MTTSPVISSITYAPLIFLDLYVATNIEDIIKYHNKYGYKLDREQLINMSNIKKHNLFDYIQFNEVVLETLLPHSTRNDIETLLESGVRFWYDYNKFLDYSQENTEV